MRTDPVKKAERDALRRAQAFLFRRAAAMSDPWARSVLISAAFEFGAYYLHGLNVTAEEVQEANPKVEGYSGEKPFGRRVPVCVVCCDNPEFCTCEAAEEKSDG